MRSTKSILIVICDTISMCCPLSVIDTLSGLSYSTKLINYFDFQDSIDQHASDLIIAFLPGDKNLDLQYCYALVKSNKVPIIVISSLDDVQTRIQAFDIDIEDYLVSPVNSMVIALRVKSILQRRM